MSADNGQRDDVRRCGALWTRAEGQLYPLIMSSPEAFERALTVVRAVADGLRAQATVEELARVFTQSGDPAVSAARETGTDIDDLDADILTSAGFSLRRQEITAGAGRAGNGPHAGAGEEDRREQMQ